MKTRTSFLQLAGSVGLIFSIQKAGASEIHAEASAQTEVSSLAGAVQGALQGMAVEAGSEASVKNQIEEHVYNELRHHMGLTQSQKTNLEESNLLDLEQDVSSPPNGPQSSTKSLNFKFYFKLINCDLEKEK